jgi:hypothetical protein
LQRLICLNVSKTNILRPSNKEEGIQEDIIDNEEDTFEASIDDFTMDEDEF